MLFLHLVTYDKDDTLAGSMERRYTIELYRKQSAICLAFLIICSIVLSCGLFIAKLHQGPLTDFQIPNFIGPTVQSLLAGHGLEVCSEGMGTPGNLICFHSARMPMGTLTIAAGVKLLGDNIERVAFLKCLLTLLPLWIAMAIILRQGLATRMYLLICTSLLLIPLLMPTYLSLVVHLAVEEGYMFGLIALAVTLLLFPWSSSWAAWTLLVALTLGGIYLTKSSMLPAVLVLLLGLLQKAPTWRIRLIVILLVALAPISWAFIQHDASGRYTLGTSLDGINLHKGNNELFLAHYPPPPEINLDVYDEQLNRGHHFDDEWSFNDYHMKSAISFILTNPINTLYGVVRKINIMFISIWHYGGNVYSNPKVMLILTMGIVVFRLLLWGAIGISVYAAVTGKSIGRVPAISFLLFIVAYSVPYIAGFAYTRHAMVLAYPAAILWCRAYLAMMPNYKH